MCHLFGKNNSVNTLFILHIVIKLLHNRYNFHFHLLFIDIICIYYIFFLKFINYKSIYNVKLKKKTKEVIESIGEFAKHFCAKNNNNYLYFTGCLNCHLILIIQKKIDFVFLA